MGQVCEVLQSPGIMSGASRTHLYMHIVHTYFEEQAGGKGVVKAWHAWLKLRARRNFRKSCGLHLTLAGQQGGCKLVGCHHIVGALLAMYVVWHVRH